MFQLQYGWQHGKVVDRKSSVIRNSVWKWSKCFFTLFTQESRFQNHWKLWNVKIYSSLEKFVFSDKECFCNTFVQIYLSRKHWYFFLQCWSPCSIIWGFHVCSNTCKFNSLQTFNIFQSMFLQSQLKFGVFFNSKHIRAIVCGML
jgi:hypothetical protein